MVNYTLKPRRLTTSIEKVYKPIKIENYDGPQVFQEIFLHWIHTLNEFGEIVGSKLDKNIFGKWYRVAGPNDRSPNGEVEINYVPPDSKNQNVKLRLVALSEDMSGKPILR